MSKRGDNLAKRPTATAWRVVYYLLTMEDRGISQGALARASGLPRQRISALLMADPSYSDASLEAGLLEIDAAITRYST